MCGIVGACGNFRPEDLSEALKRLDHRGPDSFGSFVDGDATIMLGHTRLAIIELSDQGHQPMFSPDHDVAIVFNGEIYNYRELRTELEASGIRFSGASDTEVLLQMYLSEGREMLSRLIGIFAFVLYDKRTSELLLARDSHGVKPLYIYEGAAGVAFASEIKALMPFMDKVPSIDPVAVDRYLTYLWCPGEATPFSHVRKLGPGEAMVIRHGRIEERWKWYAPPQAGPQKQALGREDAIAGVERGLRRAVERQMVADVPVGSFLSGGLDSSAIVTFAREINPDIHCFTIEARGGEESGLALDLPYARRAAAHLGVKLDVVTVDAHLMVDQVEQMIWQLDEPLADPASLNVLYISQLARSAGIKVLLSGVGGDDLFTGYRRHLAVSYDWLWAWLPADARQSLAGLSRRLDQRTALGRRASRLFGNVDDSEHVRLAKYFAWAQRNDLHALYSPDMTAAIGDAAADRPMLEYLRKMSPETSRVEKLLSLEQRFFLADHNLVYTDKMAMAAGVEVRVPFLDPDLVDFAARIPARFKQRGREGKWVLKKAMEPYLPRDLIYRPKSGFGAPLRLWLQSDLRPLMFDILSTDSLRARGLFDPAAVHQLIADNDVGRVDAAYTIFSLMCIEIWCRKFMGNNFSFDTERPEALA